MKHFQDELLALALKELRRRRSSGSGLRIDYAQWSEQARSSPIAFMATFYAPVAYACRHCGTSWVFSAADQKHVLEVLKKRLEWHATLCDGCYAVRRGIELELRDFAAAWLSQRKRLRADEVALRRWLHVLETAPSYGFRKNTGMIVHLRKRLAALSASATLDQAAPPSADRC
jgi:hypothetical protein